MGFRSRLSSILIIGSLAACQTQAPIPMTAQVAGPTSRDEPSPFVDLADNKLEARRYCRDDIFSVFLQENYLDRNKTPVSEVQSNRKARKEAQHEAYIKMNADLPVAFGGLPIQATQRVHAWIDYFTGNGRQNFMVWLVRSASLRELVVPLLKQEGLPAEFFFLAMIESGFSNTAFSRSRASGTWQFMKPTAQYYGLRINHWVDERRDPIKSTLAAARYLKDLNRQFRNWYLAIAAYNAGPNKILRAIRGANSRDYWALSRTNLLLPETKNYVPKMLAALIIASHPEHYGFSVAPDIRNTTPLTTISIKSPYRLAEIAGRLEIPTKELQRWNPEIIRGITPPQQQKVAATTSYQLRLPKPLADRFQTIEPNLQQLTIQDVQMHRIQKGETFDAIAKIYKVPREKLLQYNPDIQPLRLKPGQNVAVPLPKVSGVL